MKAPLLFAALLWLLSPREGLLNQNVLSTYLFSNLLKVQRSVYDLPEMKTRLTGRHPCQTLTAETVHTLALKPSG